MATKKKSSSKAGARSARPAVKKAVKKSAAKKTAGRKPFHTAADKPVNQAPLLRVGDRVEKEGGVYMGIARGGGQDYHVYRGRYAEKRMTHADALKFAAACRDGGHKDWELPTRTTGALLYANGRDDMRQNAWHWLQETHASIDAFAWCQDFRDGLQSFNRKGREFGVVLVRRVPIQ